MRLLLVISVLLGTAYTATWTVAVDDPIRIAWKFACVGSLAFYAILSARSLDGWLLVIVLSMSAFSDLLLETSGQVVGGLSFIVADFFAIALYVRNRRPNLGWQGWAVAIVSVLMCSALAYSLPANRDEAIGIGIFVLPLAFMTAMAWFSNFPRRFVALGALMILSSDMLIFARMGPLNAAPFINQTIWLIYFLGEVFVTIGVTRVLDTRYRRSIAIKDVCEQV